MQILLPIVLLLAAVIGMASLAMIVWANKTTPPRRDDKTCESHGHE
jgi:hypothetical protein